MVMAKTSMPKTFTWLQEKFSREQFVERFSYESYDTPQKGSLVTEFPSIKKIICI
jgi:hypothetical protein